MGKQKVDPVDHEALLKELDWNFREMREVCKLYGIRVERSMSVSRTTRSPHWRYYKRGIGILAHYWPTSGSFCSTDGTIKRQMKNWKEAMITVIRVYVLEANKGGAEG